MCCGQLASTIDATCASNRKAIYIKRVPKASTEAHIARYFSTPDILSKPENHCVPIIDFIESASEEQYDFLVMPTLRSFERPQCATVGETVDCVYQILEVSSSRRSLQTLLMPQCVILGPFIYAFTLSGS